MRRAAGTAAVIWLLSALAGSPCAEAYGPATHVWLAEEATARLAAADPSLSFLATDPDARACFAYGAVFPDIRTMGSTAAAFELIKSKILASGFVASVEFSTDEVRTVFASLNTHGGPFLL